jgi:hypothetical protein
MTGQYMNEICDRLNNTPRKYPRWEAPAEVFHQMTLGGWDERLNLRRTSFAVHPSRTVACIIY